MPAPMTTTRAASGDVLKRTLLGPVARTVATGGLTAWSAILLSPAEPHPSRQTPRPLCLDRGAANGVPRGPRWHGLLVEDPVRLVVDLLLLAGGEVALLHLLGGTRLGISRVRL